MNRTAFVPHVIEGEYFTCHSDKAIYVYERKYRDIELYGDLP